MSFGLPWRPRTMKSTRGKEVTTTMTDEAAYDLVSTLSDDMSRDLVSRPLKKFSHNQLVWLHVLANEASKSDPDPKGTL